MSTETTVVSRKLRPRRVADLFVELLLAHDVEVAFGVAGGAISPVVDALAFNQGIRRIDCQNESAAVFSAAAYARAANKPAVVFVTSGPGLLNAMNGIASAQAEGAPVIVLAGEVATHRMGQLSLQDGSPLGMNLAGMCSHIAKRALMLDNPETALTRLDFALRHAMSGRRGPVVLSLPVDVTSAKVLQYPIRAPASVDEPRSVSGDLDAVLEALTTAERPLLFVGSGSRRSALAVRALAERLQIPAVTTPKGKGIFPESHPLSLGVFGYGGHPSAQSYVDEGIDALVVLGSRLSDPATNGGDVTPLRRARYTAQVDIDPGVMGRVMPASDIVIGDIGAFATAMLARADALGIVAPTREFGVVRNPLPPPTAGGAITSAEAIAAVQKACGDNAIYLTDVGDHALAATHHLRLDRPDQFYFHTGTGSMGSGITAAIGVALAEPHRRIVVIVGDGGYIMSAPELLTAAKHGIAISIVVINDGRYGMVERGHERLFARNPGFALAELDVDQVAHGFGATPVSLGGLFKGRLTGRAAGPEVLDVPVAAADLGLFKDRFKPYSADDAEAPFESGAPL